MGYTTTPEDRERRTNRLLKLAELGLTGPQIAERTGVSRNVVYRSLIDAGRPLGPAYKARLARPSQQMAVTAGSTRHGATPAQRVLNARLCG
jgi:hypothetical protein